ncbi:hypothetical protein [Acetivibrio clariflavus]|uniref:Uncharacterized protein n=1 Tax=Acetivibrio clariflavus (strain DSM 19732 / NBRC 101661 / EBR45) TaxID=720554 RepID=G8M2W5_ACECE|nr:hypothetical protein [Acetivibrio clariflavus]AEV68229.1 hypothetical protein Clocl_1595 [Acetivibrio clariflavus DSM 19732]
MELKPDIKIALEKINFLERYKSLSTKYAFDTTECFKSYENSEVLNIFSELGYKATFNKSENFFKVVEKTPPYKFQFNISLKYGIAELIWAVWKDKIYYGGGVWIMMKKLLGDNDENIKYPRFRNYTDLKEILAEAFAIYEDFKREFLAIQ